MHSAHCAVLEIARRALGRQPWVAAQRLPRVIGNEPTENPNGVSETEPPATQPFQGWRIVLVPSPRVVAARQPWAILRKPFGLNSCPSAALQSAECTPPYGEPSNGLRNLVRFCTSLGYSRLVPKLLFGNLLLTFPIRSLGTRPKHLVAVWRIPTHVTRWIGRC